MAGRFTRLTFIKHAGLKQSLFRIRCGLQGDIFLQT